MTKAGLAEMGGNPKIALEEILVKNSSYQSNKLRIRLLKEGLKEHKCEICNNIEWNGKPIPLDKNGNNSDHRLENLEMICPNCHAQTDTYRGKNWGKAINLHHYYFNNYTKDAL